MARRVFAELRGALDRAIDGQPVNVSGVRAQLRGIIDQGEAILRDHPDHERAPSVRNSMLSAEQYDRCAALLEDGDVTGAADAWRRAVSIAMRGPGGSLEGSSPDDEREGPPDR